MLIQDDLQNIRSATASGTDEYLSGKITANWAPDSVAEQLICEDEDKEELQNYILQYYELQEAQQRIFDNPDIRKLITDKNLSNKSLLSPFTIVANNFVGMASDHLTPLDGGEKCDHGGGGGGME